MYASSGPPVNMMRLYHPRLPWYIDVVQTRAGAGGQGVTVGDVIIWTIKGRIRDFFRVGQISSRMDLMGMNREECGRNKYGSGRSLVGRAWSERCRLMGILRQQPVYALPSSDGDEMDWEARAAGHFGRRERVEMAKGVKRDWLGGEGMVNWVGLVRGKGGVWQMKTQNSV
ncbi:hypothetical protein K435DRAFT_864411 [Dendrothele bispora CBS 962.96]|uniref:DUF6699 domain-containing protein n=1 Tax=Dendrothele bispora (strain CBS 962.96) TaxID=1314807 RepID=A0A4S8LMK0_DENBC|nr:hypothetical protein K435DRAFT_864411 [Dendrothele bispora CBS 962.96]